MGTKGGDSAWIFDKQEIPISEESFFDPCFVKILDGIAGAGKSTLVHKIFQSRGISYVRTTSTNKLARDSEKRYCMPVNTIASEFFETRGGVFYSKEKKNEFSHVVIDEILQSDQRIFNWIEHNVGKINIIVCTDSKQMLAQGNEGAILKRFERLKEKSIVINISHTFRALDEPSKHMYNFLYRNCGDGHLFEKVSAMFKKKDIDDVEYSPSDMYICHTNEIEKMLYERWGLSESYHLDLIPKGGIAKRPPKDITRYPIIPQAFVSRNVSGYFQVSNISTPTRCQGCEIGKEGMLYYFLNRNSFVEDREIYTVITRARTIRNVYFVYVDCENKKNFVLKEFNGLPVKECQYFIVDEDFEVDGEKVKELIEEDGDGNKSINWKYFRSIMKSLFGEDNTHFKSNGFFMNGDFIRISSGGFEKQKITPMSLISKSPSLDLPYMDLFMKFFEDSQKEGMRRMYVDSLILPMCSYQERYKDSPFPDEKGFSVVREKESYQYGLDLKSSYVHVIKNSKLPTAYRIQREMFENGIDWYIIYSTQFSPGCLVSGEMVKFLREEEDIEAYYVCSTSYVESNPAAEKWHNYCHESKEWNEEIKKIHWGLLERPYLFGCGYGDNGKPKYYARDKNNRYILLMDAIKSEQARTMLRIRKFIYGDIYHGKIIADCIYFDYEGDIFELSENIRKEIPGYDFRVFQNSNKDKKGNVIYMTYPEVLSKEEKKRKREADRRRLAKGINV